MILLVGKKFFHWGRIVRQDGEIKAIVEFKDADEKQKDKRSEPWFIQI